MELRALFGREPGSLAYIESPLMIEPDRSPFISMRMDVLFSSPTLEGLVAQAAGLMLEGSTFKVLYLKNGLKRSYEEQRQLERLVGANIRGTADMRCPDMTFGLLSHERGWMLGLCVPADHAWRQRIHKPQNYSTGLPVATARALVNIAVPNPKGIKAIDPCCGMGNVMIEALSMDIDIVGMDLNPLAVRGARANLAHFGYENPGLVSIGDMNRVTGHFDAAILDMPYNLCSVLPGEEKRAMLASLRRFSETSVIVSTEALESDLLAEGFQILDYGQAAKDSFVRNIWVCRS
ncbi:RNA methyltransferase [Paenibacillus sp. M1]|uniref:RNA methyltransferase n=1 Tax=Paenibacillus haidiansis TaxID=1574488 RepID=A0ABU7VVS2_9BACL